MGITSYEEKTADRLAALESRFEALIVQDKPGSKKLGVGRIPFGGTTGVLTDDVNLVWDNTNKRLGVAVAAPLAYIHTKFSGGTRVGIRIENISASSDTLFDLFNSDDTIGSGSNFIVAHDNTNTYFHVRGDGTVTTAGSISTLGVNAGLRFADRTIGTVYQWYGLGNAMRLYNGTGDVLTVDLTGNTSIIGEYRISGTKVVSTRRTGWVLPTGTLSRATFDQSTVTLPQLAQRLAALITDLFSGHGLIGT